MRDKWLYPARDLGALFQAAQAARVFPDSKTLADAELLAPADTILRRYREQCASPDFDLARFVHAHFQCRDYAPQEAVPPVDILEHIDALWSTLTRSDAPQSLASSRIPLPFPYVVPGGRFDEMYYWDSYFTILGLLDSGRQALALSMVRNFLWLVRAHGHVPNGNRTYYLSRSQPPFLALMVEAASAAGLLEPSVDILHALQQEHNYWMAQGSGPDLAPIHYRDALITPRDESWLEDNALMEACNKPKICLHIRAACASGWDFSSRWLADKSSMCTIRTADIAPIDLQCLVWKLEDTIANIALALRDPKVSEAFYTLAQNRQHSIITRFFNAKSGLFDDLNAQGVPIGNRTLACAYPLFFGIATEGQAASCAATLERDFLCPGGLQTTDIHSGQQWDAPNGWAPLQYIVAQGLLRYGYDALATDIMQRWNQTVEHTYRTSGKIKEKYNVVDPLIPGGGGEYPNQDGFGWTNAVYTLFHRHLQSSRS